MIGYAMRPTYEYKWQKDALLKSGPSAGKKKILDKWGTAFPECFNEILDMANVAVYEYQPSGYQARNPVSGEIYEVGPRLILLDRLMDCINEHAGDGIDHGPGIGSAPGSTIALRPRRIRRAGD